MMKTRDAVMYLCIAAFTSGCSALGEYIDKRVELGVQQGLQQGLAHTVKEILAEDERMRENRLSEMVQKSLRRVAKLYIERSFRVSKNENSEQALPGGGVFYKHSDGNLYILTARHVSIQDCLTQDKVTPSGVETECISRDKLEELTYWKTDGQQVPLESTRDDHTRDVVIFKVPAELAQRIPDYYTAADIEENVKVGQVVYILGPGQNHWKGQGGVLRQGIIGSLDGPDYEHDPYKNPKQILTITAGPVPGDSGTPLVTVDGKLIGLILSIEKYNNIGYAITISSALSPLKNQNPLEDSPGWHKGVMGTGRTGY